MCIVERLKQLPYLFFSFLLIVLVNPALATEIEPAPQNRQPTLQMTSLEVSKSTDSSKIHQLINHIRKKYRVSQSKASAIVTEVFRSGVQHGLEPELILAVIAIESTFRVKAVSVKGARGLMQVMAKAHPKKVEEIGGISALFNLQKNIHTGAKILADYLKISRGNLRKALLRYNGSLKNPNSRYADKVLYVYQEIKKVATLREIQPEV
jgi:soluble lytic murein transglycosylase-like protein